MQHPLHPALVHFPVCCWSLTVAADFAQAGLSINLGAGVSLLLWAGCIMALVSMAAGLADFSKVPEGPAMRAGYWHMSGVLLAFLLFGARLFVHTQSTGANPPSLMVLALDTAGMVCLLVGGWFGGQLVYVHGVGQRRHNGSPHTSKLHDD